MTALHAQRIGRHAFCLRSKRGTQSLLSREALYELVWCEPMTKVAERFGVSGSYMARVCTVLNVPRPERGHWAKLSVGKARPPDPLPEARPGDPLYWSKEGELSPAPRPPRPPSRASALQARIPRSRIHGLIRGAKVHFESGRPVDEGAYLKPYKKLLVDVTASKGCLDKALDLANDLFNGLESVGYRVVLAPSDAQLGRAAVDEREVRTKQRSPYYHRGPWSLYRPTVVYVGSVAIGLAVVEMSADILLRYVNGKYIRDADYSPPKSRRFTDHSWTTTREMPSGRLRIVAYSPYPRVDWSMEWQEASKTSLRSSLKSIIKSIEDAAPVLVARLEEAERKAEIAREEWLAAEARRRKEDDRRRVEQSIRDSREQLASVIQQWSNAMEIERFLAGVESRASELPHDRKQPILKRLELARSFLGTHDPLDFFLSWRTPEERHRPAYSDAEGPGKD